MQKFPDEESRRKSRPLIYAFNRIVIVTSLAILGSLLLNLMFQAFVLDIEAGLRSFAAVALPPLIISYVAFFNQAVRPQSSLPDVGFFVVFAAWMLILMVVQDIVHNYLHNAVPLGEFVLSLTLSILAFIARYIPFRSLLSCSYGILSGFLMYILIFGLSTTR